MVSVLESILSVGSDSRKHYIGEKGEEKAEAVATNALRIRIMKP
jgi:hypothetical protein